MLIKLRFLEAKFSLIKSSSEKIAERKKVAMESNIMEAISAAHTHGARGSRKAHGSTSGLPRPANTLRYTNEIGQVKSMPSWRAASMEKGPRPKLTS